MQTSDLYTDFKDLTNEEFERKLNKLMRENYRYSNIDKENKKYLLSLIMKYRDKIRRGLGISSYNLRDEYRKMYKERIQRNLTEKDMKDIKEILEMWKK